MQKKDDRSVWVETIVLRICRKDDDSQEAPLEQACLSLPEKAGNQPHTSSRGPKFQADKFQWKQKNAKNLLNYYYSI